MFSQFLLQDVSFKKYPILISYYKKFDTCLKEKDNLSEQVSHSVYLDEKKKNHRHVTAYVTRNMHEIFSNNS